MQTCLSSLHLLNLTIQFASPQSPGEVSGDSLTFPISPRKESCRESGANDQSYELGDQYQHDSAEALCHQEQAIEDSHTRTEQTCQHTHDDPLFTRVLTSSGQQTAIDQRLASFH